MIENESETIKYKIVLYGDNYAGTTSLLRQYIYNSFDPDFYSYSNYYLDKKITLKNHTEVLVHFWDLFHSERYYSINKIFFKGANGFMLTYDTTKRRSFDTMKELLNRILDFEENIPIALVACKIDLFMEEEIRQREGENFAEENGLFFYETSAKENLNVYECFNDFINKIVPNNEDKSNDIINIKNERPPKKGCLK